VRHQTCVLAEDSFIVIIFDSLDIYLDFFFFFFKRLLMLEVRLG